MSVRSILYVEDDTFLQTMVQDLLGEAGVNVILSSSVNDALLKIGNQKFDLFLFDYNLGHNKTSEILISEVRRVQKSSHILLMSGVLDIQIVKKLKKQVDGILVKPVTPEALEQAVFKFDEL